MSRQRGGEGVEEVSEGERYRCGVERELYSTEKGGAVHRILHSTGLSVVL